MSGPGVSDFHKAVGSLSLPQYHPLLSSQTRTEYLAEALRELESYTERVERAVERLGVRQATKKHNLDHFKWLALRQVRGQRPSEIAASFTRGRATALTVRNGLKATAALIGLKLRPVSPGPSAF
jgi:hypothetical protein